MEFLALFINFSFVYCFFDFITVFSDLLLMFSMFYCFFCFDGRAKGLAQSLDREEEKE